MRINNVSLIPFKQKIFDAHFHIGSWNELGNLKDYTSNIDSFTKSTLKNGDTIEKIIVSNLDCMNKNNSKSFIADEIEGNNRLLRLAEKNEKIIPLVTCQPGLGSADNIKILLEENPNKIFGLKFHPKQLNLAANDKLYEPYLELAQKEKLPCLFHSGSEHYSNPQNIYEMAKKYPDVKVVIAHWGAEEGGNYDKVTDIIIESVKTKNSKVYADISWVDCNNVEKPNLKKIITRLKEENALDRVMFGSDAPLGRFGQKGEKDSSHLKAYTKTIDDIKNMIKKEFSSSEAEEIINKIFYQNANDVFFVDNKNKITKPSVPKQINSKVALLLGAVFTVLLGALYLKETNIVKKDVEK